MLDEAGFPDAFISASSDLDEYLIDSLKTQGAKITSWGVGTNLITSKDCPAFGGVYKLAAVLDENTDEFIPKIKLSENTEKITNPGNKTVYRIYDKKTGKIRADLISLVGETFSESEDMIIFDPQETWKKPKSTKTPSPSGSFWFLSSRKGYVFMNLPLLWRSVPSVRKNWIPCGMKPSVWQTPTKCM